MNGSLLPQEVEIGGASVSAEVRGFFAGSSVLGSPSKGETISVVGRIAYCRLSPEEGGKLVLEIAHCEPVGSDRKLVPAIPEVKIVHAKFGPKEVTELVSRKVIDQRIPVWANRKSMEGDPAPGWKKSLTVSVSVNGQVRKLTRGSGKKLSFEDFFPKAE